MQIINYGPLRWAGQCGHLKNVKFLLEKGSNVHAGNDHALRWAKLNDHSEVVNFLEYILKINS